MTTNDNPNLDIFIQNLKDVFDLFEDAESDTLNSLRDIQAIRNSIRHHEAIRLERKLGAGHPRILEIKARIERTPAMVNELDVEVEKAKVKVPEVNERDALVHGTVTDDRGLGLSGLTVYAENDEKEPIRFIGSAETDASGFFALRLDPETIKRISDIQGEGAFIAVRTSGRLVVHRQDKPLVISEGGQLVLDLGLNRADLSPTGDVIRRPPLPRDPDDGGQRKQRRLLQWLYRRGFRWRLLQWLCSRVFR